MSNEAKGPYTTGYMRGLRTVIDGSGVVVYSDDTSAGVNMFADAANYAHSQALTSQAARVRELEIAANTLSKAAWELMVHHNGGDGFSVSDRDQSEWAVLTRRFVVAVNNLAALTPKEAQ